MRVEHAAAVGVIALWLPAVAAAQTGGAVTPLRSAEVSKQGDSPVRLVAGAVETRIVTGNPYTAEATTEVLQVLADGNRITRRSVTRVYRDGAGRTRRDAIGEDGRVRTISISDPVASASYTLNPETKVAVKINRTIIAPTVLTPSSAARTAAGGAAREIVAPASGDRQPAVATLARGGRGGAATATLQRTPAPDSSNVTKEELGTHNVEGVMATGTRTTTIIPAGQIGNAQEIRVVSERWFSDELQVLVMTRHSDPRSGETIYRLRNILRAEPDPALFAVPSDYTLQERSIRPQ